MKASLLSLALVGLLLVSSGCDGTVEAKFHLDEDARVAILPARDPEFGGGIFSSPRGRDIAIRCSEILAYELDAERVVEPDRYLERFARMERDFLRSPLHKIAGSDDPYTLTDQDIADKIDAEYVCFIDIDDKGWSTRPYGSVNVLRGNSRLRVRVYDKRGLKLKLIGSERVRARYPTDYYKRDGIVSFDGSENEIESGLIRSSGKQIALLFYDHDPEEATNFNVSLK